MRHDTKYQQTRTGAWSTAWPTLLFPSQRTSDTYYSPNSCQTTNVNTAKVPVNRTDQRIEAIADQLFVNTGVSQS